MKRYFENANTLEELRKQYKELLRKHHPDNGRNVADMQEINVEYDRLFRLLKDKHESQPNHFPSHKEQPCISCESSANVNFRASVFEIHNF